ncbi:MAG: dnaJ 2 [Mucilaginibacter sp.]|nr:dnaJ 2 [Mucilaginibacter sp.]
MNDIKPNPIDEEFERRKLYRQQAGDQRRYNANSAPGRHKRGPGVGISIVLIIVGLIFAVYLVKSFSGSKPKAIKPASSAVIVKIARRHHKRRHPVKSAGLKDFNVSQTDTIVTKPIKVNSGKQVEFKPQTAKMTEPLVVKPVMAASGFLYTSYVKPNITGIVNMRESGNYSSAVIAILPADSKVYVMEKGNIYYKVSCNGSIGYIPKWSLQRK